MKTSLRNSALSWLIRASLPVLLTCIGGGSAVAGVIYVDNLRGDNVADGSNPTTVDFTSGPVRTISRGLQLIQLGGTLNIANNGQPYYESLELVGGRLSGSPLSPLVIEGNGAELNGSFPVPPAAWRKVEEQLWKFTPFRKGHYQLILENKALPETSVPPNSRRLPELPEGHWAAWRGDIYLRTSTLEVPTDLDLWFAVRSMGVTLYDVHDVVVRNLKVRQFRIDGFNAHDRCKNIVLENITSEENGRAGVTAAGTSFVTMENPTIKNNRLHSVFITEKAGVQINDETQVQPAPTVAE